MPAYRQGATPSKPGFKLSSNENPFATLPQVAAAVSATPVNRYAAAAMPQLRSAIGSMFGLDPADSAAAVHLGAGSVSILYQLIQATAGAGDEYLYAWPSFEGYPLLGIASQATPVTVPLTDAAEHDLEAMADAITDQTRVILLCSPNNPTGPAIFATEFTRFMSRVPADVLVVLDEAYREFVTDPEAVHGEEVLATYDNLVVLRTFSKAYGLASLRIGYGVGHPAIWEAARVTGIPLAVTAQAEAAALASITPEAQSALQQQISQLVQQRDTLVAELRTLGLRVPEAQGNFVWLPLREHSNSLAAAFSEEGTLVRSFAGEGVRISVGEPESLPEVLRVIESFIQAHPDVVNSGGTQ